MLAKTQPIPVKLIPFLFLPHALTPSLYKSLPPSTLVPFRLTRPLYMVLYKLLAPVRFTVTEVCKVLGVVAALEDKDKDVDEEAQREEQQVQPKSWLDLTYWMNTARTRVESVVRTTVVFPPAQVTYSLSVKEAVALLVLYKAKPRRSITQDGNGGGDDATDKSAVRRLSDAIFGSSAESNPNEAQTGAQSGAKKEATGGRGGSRDGAKDKKKDKKDKKDRRTSIDRFMAGLAMMTK
jgi:hypothetical protein